MWISINAKQFKGIATFTNKSVFFSLFRGNVDRFEFSSKNLGDIAGICLGHTPKDGKKVKGEVYWHVEEVVVTERELGNK